MVSTILLFIKDEPMETLLRFELEAEGYIVLNECDLSQPIDTNGSGNINVVFIEYALNDREMLDLYASLRRRIDLHRPLVYLITNPDDLEIARASMPDADAFISKPLPLSDVIESIHYHLHRRGPRSTSVVEGDIVINRAAGTAFRGARQLRLAPVEFQLFEFLLSHKGKVFNRRQLVLRVWGLGAQVEERTIDVLIGRIRGALNRGADPDPLRTVPSVGYGFDDRYAPKPALAPLCRPISTKTRRRKSRLSTPD